MALFGFYDYSDGYRQSVGYLCSDRIQHMDTAMFQLWLQETIWKVHSYLVIYPTQIGDLRIMIAGVTRAEEIVPDTVISTIPARLEAGLRAVTHRLVPIENGEADSLAGPPESVIQRISFGVERDASPEDYNRK